MRNLKAGGLFSQRLVAAMTVALMLPLCASAGQQKNKKKSDEAETEVKVTEESSPLGGFGGTVIYENSVSKGVFTDSQIDDNNYNMSFSIRPHYVIDKDLKLKLTVRLDFDVNIVEDFASSNTRQNEVQFRDIAVILGFSDFVRIEPANLYWSTSLSLTLPTSKASDIQNKILGLSLSLKTSYRPVKWFNLGYTFAVGKNFNRFTNSVLDVSGFDAPPSTRAGGGGDVGEGLVAIGAARSVEWRTTHSLAAGFAHAGFSFDLAFTYYQYFVYDGASSTAGSSSKFANSARGNRDLMRGVIEFGYTVNKHLAFGLGTLTDQSPLDSQNDSVRFPFWDTTNGSDNRQVFYLDVVGSF